MAGVTRGAAKAPPRKRPAQASGTQARGARSRTPARGSRKPTDVLARITDHLRCPITLQLLVDPVLAEDGCVYERRALEQWLTQHTISPTTRMPMGHAFSPAILVRKTVSELVDGGVLDDEVVRDFLMQRGHVRASRTSLPGPDLQGAREDISRAQQLARQTGRAGENATFALQLKALAWLQEGVDLFARARDQEHEDSSTDLRQWLWDISTAVPMAVTRPLARRLTSWEPLIKGQRVRMIEDVVELQKYCERPAPGATEKVGWVADMVPFAGSISIVEVLGDEEHQNYIVWLDCPRQERTFSFPYDVVIVPA